MIDLHTHTTESDGSLTPVELISEGRRVGLEALAITDHDTLDGYDKAAPVAHGIELIRGIELSTSWQSRSVHLLAYFPHGDPGNEFRDWVLTLNHQRRQRNLLLAEKLRTAGFPIDFDEFSRGAGPRICRPHFAAAMVEKGYVASRQEAFDRFLAESGSCFVPREEPNFVEAVLKIRLARGVSVLAHPARIVRDPSCLAAHLGWMRAAGLLGLEAYHSDHSLDGQIAWAALAREHSLIITGGSDFHGAGNSKDELGTGIDGNLCVPYAVVDQLRSVL